MSISPKKRLLVEALQSSYEVLPGKLSIGNSDLAYDHGLLPDCNAFNVGHSYLIYSIPDLPDSKTRDRTPGLDGNYITYKLRQDEAIVFVGKTPPSVDYFSWRSYMFWRFYPRDSHFRIIFSSLGDTINKVRVKVEDSKDPCDQPVVIISTANQDTYEEVKDIMIKAGYPESMINFDKIPIEMVKMGLQSQDDQFSVLLRLGNFTNEKDRDRYLANVNEESGSLYRLTPKEEKVVAPIPGATDLIPRGSGKQNEAVYTQKLDELRDKILDKYSHLQATELSSKVWIFEGYDGIQRGIDVYGEDRDTSYIRTESFTLNKKKNEFVVVYGLNHHQTGKATYCSFGAYGEKILNGVKSISSSKENFSGDASDFFEPNDEDAEKFYVWKLGRQEERRMKGESYMKIPYRPLPSPPNSAFIRNATCVPLDEEVFIGFRAYVDPATGVGPAWWEILYGRAIKFSPYK